MSKITLQLAKAHMNIDLPDDDEIISLYIGAAEQWLENYIGKPLVTIDPFPDDLKLALVKLVSFHYENREAVAYGVTGQIIPFSVTSVADAYRQQWFGEEAAMSATDEEGEAGNG